MEILKSFCNFVGWIVIWRDCHHDIFFFLILHSNFGFHIIDLAVRERERVGLAHGFMAAIYIVMLKRDEGEI